MFWHNFKYNLLIILRDKAQIFWSFIFVIALGTLFQVTFGNAYSKSELVRDLDVAVYIEDENVSYIFDNFIANISISGDGEKLLNITYADSIDEAAGLLDDKKVRGVFYSEDNELKLMVRAAGLNQGGMDIQDGILASVVTDYHQIFTVADAINKKTDINPLSLIGLMSSNGDNNTEKVIADGKMDAFTEYFYNLIAMGWLFASFTGLAITKYSQANLSTLGARKCVAQTSTFASTTAALLANLLILYICEILAMVYLTIIGVDFGDKLWQMALLVLIGTWTGLSMGYFIGSISKLNQNAKEGIAVGVSLTLCFLSGLMIVDMKFIMKEKCPLFNKLNPAALISDTFYALNVYQENTQYMKNIFSLLVISVVFVIAGTLIGRRRTYASI